MKNLLKTIIFQKEYYFVLHWIDVSYESCLFTTEESPSKHGSQPGSSSTSPRATTPKRGPPPLVYTSHSSMNSPPVVTIAPTQSHASIISSDSRRVNLTMLNHIHFWTLPLGGNNSPDTVSCQHRLKRFSSGKSYNVKSHSFLNSPPCGKIAQTQSHASIVSSDSHQVNLTMLNHIHFWTLPMW